MNSSISVLVAFIIFQSIYFIAFGQDLTCGVEDPEETTPGDPSFAITADSLIIPVVVHIVSANDGTGNIADWQVQAQIDTLNASFSRKETRYRFYLAAVSRVQNEEWHTATGNSVEETETPRTLACPSLTFSCV